MLSLSISAEAEAKLRAKAAAAGVDVETYATRQLELLAAPPASLKDICGPDRPDLTEDELSRFLEAEKHAARADRRSNRAG